MRRECDNCGREFDVPKKAHTRFCSSKCAIEEREARRAPQEQATELDRFMAQPEIAQLRAGIQVAIRTAWTRCFGG